MVFQTTADAFPFDGSEWQGIARLDTDSDGVCSGALGILPSNSTTSRLLLILGVRPVKGDVDDNDDESVPGFEVWLLILAMLFAVSFRRKLNV